MSVKIAAASLSLLLLMGCSQHVSNDLGVYAQASNQLTTQLGEMMQENKALQTQRATRTLALELENPTTLLTSDRLTRQAKTYADINQQQLTLFRLNNSLKEYSQALGELADARYRADIDYAAARLSGAMIRANHQYEKLTEKPLFDTDEDTFFVLSSAIAGIGSTVAESQRRKALKAIILSSDPAVSAICDAISQRLASGRFYASLLSERRDNLSTDIRQFNLMKTQGKLSRQDIISQIEILTQRSVNIAATELIFQQLGAATQTLKDKHHEIANLVANDEFSGKAFIRIAGELRDTGRHYASLNDLLSSCETGFELKDDQLICKDDA
ncbi:hypothetical protein [Photobacterium sp. 1_MG-2023]|uniref:hypothetical protein n=1 Tax=Photobacterium sp. 1_MG-2023 TaxID=3062646 RepID=UPI0026E306D1|nr:hypothetical protein [Photobacterium sp. 1_MG-2023]MDO6707217.1 hypothetical protein [Photobacterium sp. 1_MG-2023]